MFLKKWFGLISLFMLALVGVWMSMGFSKVFLIWVGLEVKMFGFVPLLIMKNTKFNESLIDNMEQLNVSLYYFLIQVVGSLLFAWSCLLGWGVLGMMGLSMKTGMPPFFWWVPVLISRLDWYSIILISSIQKIAPLVILRSIFDYSMEFCMFILSVGMIMSIVGINYSSNDMKMVMGWSSVGKMSLVFFLLGGWLNLGVAYFMLYMVSMLMMGSSFNTEDNGKFSMKKDNFNNVKVLMLSSLLMLMFSGLPPFLGFISKIYLFAGLSIKECLICIKESLFFSKLKYMMSYPYSDMLGGWMIGVNISFLLIIQMMGYIKVFINIYMSYCFGLIKNQLKNKGFGLELCMFLLFLMSFCMKCI